MGRGAIATRATAFATAGNTLVFATGLSVVIGWFFGLPPLIYLFSPGPNIKTNTGVALACAATANQLLMARDGRGWRMAVGRFLATVALLAGGLTLTEHIMGWNLGIDELLAAEAPGALATMSPNRMGPPASTTFVLLGSALLIIDLRRRGAHLVGQALVLAACTIALLPIMGYAYGVSPLYAVARYTGIALTTAVALLVLGLSVLTGRPDRGVVALISREDEVGALVRGLVPATLLLPLGAGWLLSRAVHTGLFDSAFAISAMVLILVIGLSALIWRTSTQLARAFDARMAAERALSASERSLRESDRQKNEFLATLSHELRNPLAPIRFAVELLNGPPDTAARARDSIRRQIKHLTRLIDDLLDLTRITRNKLQLQRRDVELQSLVHDAVDSCSALIASSGHSLDVRLPEEPVWLHADADRIIQVFTNLLGNAARYTPPGGRIVVEAQRRRLDVVVSVRDNGVGLAAGDLSRVFDMFVQVGEGRHGGLGIGLALVKGLVELHGGSVEALSAGRDRGAEFRVQLPRTTAPVTRADEEAGGAAIEPRRVLVVDDNEDAADRLADFLRERGHEVEVCYAAEDALRRVQTFLPHVGLFDIGLPGMNGYQLAERVRAIGAGAHMLLIAITGWGQQDDRRAALAAGFDAHLTKPADPDAVLSLLGKQGACIRVN